MNKKGIIFLAGVSFSIIALTLLGRYQRNSFRKTLEQMREDFLKTEDLDEYPDDPDE